VQLRLFQFAFPTHVLQVALLVLLVLCCCRAQPPNHAFLRYGEDRQLHISDGRVNVTLQALLEQLSTLAAGQAALLAGQSSLAAALAASQSTLTSGLSALTDEVCRWGRVESFQWVATQGARDWEPFSIDGQSFLAVANFFNGTSFSVNSQVLRFNGTMFVPFQFIPTQGAYDIEYFSIANQHYLAIANYHIGITSSLNSQIMRFNGSIFVPFQPIPTQGAFACRFFIIGSTSYLAVVDMVKAQILRFNGSAFVLAQRILSSDFVASSVDVFTVGNQTFLLAPDINSDLQILRFNGSSFVPFQSFQYVDLYSATGSEFFTIGTQSFLAIADDELQILQFNGSSFVPFQSILVGQIRGDPGYFSIGGRSYLAVGNSVNLLILQFNGRQFVSFLSIPAQAVSDVEFISIGAQGYLALAIPYNGTSYSANSQILRLVTPCF
jgi:hypothetical protein